MCSKGETRDMDKTQHNQLSEVPMEVGGDG